MTEISDTQMVWFRVGTFIMCVGMLDFTLDSIMRKRPNADQKGFVCVTKGMYFSQKIEGALRLVVLQSGEKYTSVSLLERLKAFNEVRNRIVHGHFAVRQDGSFVAYSLTDSKTARFHDEDLDPKTLELKTREMLDIRDELATAEGLTDAEMGARHLF